jgi:hypothetical protein
MYENDHQIKKLIITIFCLIGMIGICVGLIAHLFLIIYSLC